MLDRLRRYCGSHQMRKREEIEKETEQINSRAARALKPIYERQILGRSILLFEGADRQQLAAFGDVRTPSIADLFVAKLGGGNGGAAKGAAQ